MRLLFLSNLYPPYGQGGYEEWCQEMATQLRARGHEIIVLTSRHALERADNNDPSWVRRELHLEMELVSLRNGIQFLPIAANMSAKTWRCCALIFTVSAQKRW